MFHIAMGTDDRTMQLWLSVLYVVGGVLIATGTVLAAWLPLPQPGPCGWQTKLFTLNRKNTYQSSKECRS